MTLLDWLPITKKETDLRGWDEVDIVFVTGDAYVDHPAFGAAVIGRVLEHNGFRVALIPQPNWRDDLREALCGAAGGRHCVRWLQRCGLPR